jgi:hypothetical protein
MCYEYLSNKEISKQQRENRRQVASFWRKVDAWIREITAMPATDKAVASRHPQEEKITG